MDVYVVWLLSSLLSRPVTKTYWFYSVSGICPSSTLLSSVVALFILASYLGFFSPVSSPHPHPPTPSFSLISLKPQVRSCRSSANTVVMSSPGPPTPIILPCTWRLPFCPQLLPLAPCSHPLGYLSCQRHVLFFVAVSWLLSYLLPTVPRPFWPRLFCLANSCLSFKTHLKWHFLWNLC